jgi:putative tricarboxylic transport membrane protein
VSEPETNGPGWHALAAVAGMLFVLAAVIAYDASLMAPAQAVGVGPTPAMRIVALLLVVLGIAHVVAALRLRVNRRGTQASELDAVLTNRSALGWVLGGLVGMIVILQIGGGFVIGSTWLFVATARAFGQPIRVKSPAIGFALAAIVFAFFTQALSLSLPAGPLERLFIG